MKTFVQSAGRLGNFAGAGLVVLAFLMSTPANSDERLTADTAGPRLENPHKLDGITAYNTAIEFYRAAKYSAALAQIRIAVRSRELTGRDAGFGFANLCLMYLHAREWKQAFAACVKAKRMLPGYGPVLTNIRRIKARQSID